MIEPHVSDADSRLQARMITIKRSVMDIVRAAILLPASLVGLSATLVSGGPRRVGRLLHVGTGILLGALSLLAIGLEVFFVVRGVLGGLKRRPGRRRASWPPARSGSQARAQRGLAPVLVPRVLTTDPITGCRPSAHRRRGSSSILLV
jgi:hypothetical protein